MFRHDSHFAALLALSVGCGGSTAKIDLFDDPPAGDADVDADTDSDTDAWV